MSAVVAAPVMTSAPRTVLPATTYGAYGGAIGGYGGAIGGFGGAIGGYGATFPATYGTTLPTTTLGATTALPVGGSISAPVGGSISAPISAGYGTTYPSTYGTGSFVGSPGLSLPVGAIGASALPPVPMLGHSYQSATYSAPTVAPMMGGSITAPMSPMSPMSPTTRTAIVPRSNMFSGYAATPFLAPSQYNIGTSTALGTAVSNVMGATYGASYPGLTAGTYASGGYISGATYPATTYPATTTYSTAAAGSVTTPA